MDFSTPGLPEVYPNSCPLSQWWHPTISSSVVPFSFCPQSFPESGSFQKSQPITSSGQSIGVSATTSFQHPSNSLSFQWIFRTDFFQDGLVVSPCSPRNSQESSPTPQLKSINSSALSSDCNLAQFFLTVPSFYSAIRIPTNKHNQRW